LLSSLWFLRLFDLFSGKLLQHLPFACLPLPSPSPAPFTLPLLQSLLVPPSLTLFALYLPLFIFGFQRCLIGFIFYFLSSLRCSNVSLSFGQMQRVALRFVHNFMEMQREKETAAAVSERDRERESRITTGILQGSCFGLDINQGVIEIV